MRWKHHVKKLRYGGIARILIKQGKVLRIYLRYGILKRSEQKYENKRKKKAEEVADKILMDAKKLNIQFIHSDEEMKQKLVNILLTVK